MPANKSKPHNLVCLNEMAEAIEDALTFVAGKTLKDLREDRILTLALIKSLEIVSTSACRTTKDFQEAHSIIPWKALKDMRQRLLKSYFDWDIEMLWASTKQDLPSLLQTLRKASAHI